MWSRHSNFMRNCIKYRFVISWEIVSSTDSSIGLCICNFNDVFGSNYTEEPPWVRTTGFSNEHLTLKRAILPTNPTSSSKPDHFFQFGLSLICSPVTLPCLLSSASIVYIIPSEIVHQLSCLGRFNVVQTIFLRSKEQQRPRFSLGCAEGETINMMEVRMEGRRDLWTKNSFLREFLSI